MTLVDTHTHLDGPARRGEMPGLLARAREAGVERMIAIGTEPDDWDLNRDLAREHPGRVSYTVGIHPCSLPEDWEGAVAKLPAYWDGAAGEPVALGECGLDRFHLPKEPDAAARALERQKAAFVAQLALARRLACPEIGRAHV